MKNIYTDLKATLSKKGINIINVDYYDYITDWKQWYSGYFPNFHSYDVKLADGSVVNKERLTMNMPKKVCEDRSKLVWNEKCNIKLDSDEATKRLWEILDSKKNNFSIMMPKMLELAYAEGTTAFSEFKDKQGNTVIEYITDALNIVPYSYDNYNITGMCVLDQFTEVERNKPIYYTHITFHEYKDGNYIKYNELYKSKDPNSLGKEIDFETMFPDVENPVIYEGVEQPHFQIYRPNIANNFDIDTPMGLSILANNIDRFKAIDTKYDSFTNEFIQGKKRILVDKTALKGTPTVDDEGNITSVLYFDKNDDTYVAISGMQDQPIKDIDMHIRYNEHIDSINGELTWLGANVGFGEGQYRFDGNRVVTATQILSEDSDAYRTKNTDEIVLKDVIYDLVKSICYLEGIQTKKDLLYKVSKELNFPIWDENNWDAFNDWLRFIYEPFDKYKAVKIVFKNCGNLHEDVKKIFFKILQGSATGDGAGFSSDNGYHVACYYEILDS